MEEEGRGKPDRKGALILSYRTSSPRWLLQHVLSYGEAAEILEPEYLRKSLVEQLKMMADSYRE